MAEVKPTRLTLGAKLREHKGIGPGFDLIRIGLATLILFGHCFWIAGLASSKNCATSSQGVILQTCCTAPVQCGSARHLTAPTVQPAPATSIQQPKKQTQVLHYVPRILPGQTYFRLMLVPMFFAVSGFLVTGSAFRANSLKIFLINRALRIVPALIAEVTLSALVLGPLLTIFTIRAYFTDIRVWDYFGNVIGRVRFQLPGLFLQNPVPTVVNANLWTLPSELYCYLIVAALLAASLLANRKTFTLIFVLVTSWLIANNVRSIIDGQAIEFLTQTLIVYCFFSGCLIFHWRDYVPYHPALFLGSMLASYFLYHCQLVLVAPLFISYAVFYVGMTALPRVPLIQTGDYSYGVYLYGFPICQAAICVIPWLRGQGWLLFGIAAPLVLSFAVFSWHFVEKPALALKCAMKSPLAYQEEAGGGAADTQG